MGKSKQATSVLKTLAVTNSEDLEILKMFLAWAQKASQGLRSDFHYLLNNLPLEAQRYFYGLVEAMEIYHSLHGPTLSPEEITAEGKLQELRQIRDLCLFDGHRTAY